MLILRDFRVGPGPELPVKRPQQARKRQQTPAKQTPAHQKRRFWDSGVAQHPKTNPPTKRSENESPGFNFPRGHFGNHLSHSHLFRWIFSFRPSKAADPCAPAEWDQALESNGHGERRATNAAVYFQDTKVGRKMEGPNVFLLKVRLKLGSS